MSSVDVVILCVDITKGISNLELNIIENYSKQNIKVLLLLTKIDLVLDNKVFEELSKYAYLTDKCELVPISSYKNRNLNTLLNLIKENLPEVEEEEKFYSEETYTDKPLRFIVSEIIREKALFYLDKEIPHGIAVAIEDYDESDPELVCIDACIVCDKDSHKAIILGKQGQMLKKIGHEARVSIQKILQTKVVLNIFVKVKPNWKNNLEFLSSLGYNLNEI